MIDELLERLEKAGGPLEYPEIYDAAQMLVSILAAPPRMVRLAVCALEGSLDAVLALVEEKLPGQGWSLLYSAMMDWRTHVEPDVRRRLPLALLKALLLALKSSSAELSEAPGGHENTVPSPSLEEG